MYRLDDLLEKGFTERFARYFLQKCEEDLANSDTLLKNFMEKGFLNSSISIYQQAALIDKRDFILEKYVSDYNYDRLWPLNDWMRIWVNDKLTLKYILGGEKHLDDCMPEYYFYTQGKRIRKLLDNKNNGQSIEDFLKLLEEKKIFACKPCNGQKAEGFYKLSYEDGKFAINDVQCTKDDINEFVFEHPNYIFTEYLVPEHSLGKISEKIHTIRILVLNSEGNNPKIIPSCYIRFGTAALGASNYITSDSRTDFVIFAGVDVENGHFGNAKAFYNDGRVESMEYHPDTNVKIEGDILKWKVACEKILEISKRLFGVEWLGFDACVDIHGDVKIMEINTYPGIQYTQAFAPLLEDSDVKKYFEDKLDTLNKLSKMQIKERNRIAR